MASAIAGLRTSATTGHGCGPTPLRGETPTGQIIPLASTLPRFQAPEIKYEQPLWHARVRNRRCPTVTVHASTRVEAKFRGAAHFGCHVQIIEVQEAYDPERLRLGRLA